MMVKLEHDKKSDGNLAKASVEQLQPSADYRMTIKFNAILTTVR